MKKLLIITLLAFGFNASAQTGKLKLDSSKPVLTVETSCGECQFKLKGKSCDLAVRIEGKAYFVDGTKIDDHGDAHAKEGFCNAVRKAEVQGEIKNERFIVTYFKLLPEIKKD
jgi:hypothetical protein